MTIDNVSKQVQDALREAQASSGRVGPGAKSQPGAGPEFENLLEKLQRLRVTGEKSPGGATAAEGLGEDGARAGAGAGGRAEDPVAQLSDAVKRADEAHETAMDIKRRLEEAFRRATRGE